MFSKISPLKLSLSLILIFLLPISLIGQQSPSLDQKLEGKTNYYEIMNIVDNHYAAINRGEIKETNERSYKHWARWSLDASTRLDENGDVQDLLPFIKKALKNYDPRTENMRTSVGSWIPLGPSSINSSIGTAVGIGRINRIGFHPTDPNTFYLCSPGGGLLKTTNGGNTYIALTDFLPVIASSGIIVSHTNPNTLYLMTGDGDGGVQTSDGVYVSYDAGINWLRTGSFPATSSFNGFNIAQDPNNASVLIAATTIGLFRTNNGGATWTQVSSNLAYEIKFKPGSSTIAYATGNGTFYRSLNGGVSWSIITNMNPAIPSSRLALAVSNGNPNRVYLFSGWTEPNNGCTDIGGFGGIYLSEDSGLSFIRKRSTPNIVTGCCDGSNGRSQASYDLAIGVSHTNASVFTTGGLRAWGGYFGTSGTSLTVMDPACSDISSGNLHVDIHDIEYNPLNDRVYICNDGGLASSPDYGITWSDHSAGLELSQAYYMGGSQINTDNYMIGLQDNGMKRHENDETPWDHVAGGDGYQVVYDKTNSTFGYFTDNASIFRFSNNGGNTFNRNPPASIYEIHMFPMVQVHNTNPSIVFAGYRDILKSTDAGLSWMNKGASGNWDVEVAPSDNSVFYAAGDNSGESGGIPRMYRSFDTGENWTDLTGSVGFPYPLTRITDIEISPINFNQVWITLGNVIDGQKVYFSPDAGASWQNISHNLPNIPAYCIQVDESNNAYLGTAIGVYYKAQTSNIWIPFWHKLPISQIRDLEIYTSSGILRAATFGRGIWQSNLYGQCFTDLNITTSYSGRRYFEASNSITLNNVIYGGLNTDVTMKAGNEIIYNAGFEIKKGNNMRAYIAPCGVIIE